MSVKSFQRACCDLAASPALCLAVRDDPNSVLKRYDLTEREHRRLVDIVWQPGMSINCTIYRSNRLTPIWTLLNKTCFLLGDDVLSREVDLFWQNDEQVDLQYSLEIDRFARFLKQRIQSGAINDPLIEEVLDLELAINFLQFCSRRQILGEVKRQVTEDCSGAVKLYPLARVVKFKHDPVLVLQYLADTVRPPYILEEGEFFLLVTLIEGPLEVRELSPEIGAKLLALQISVANQ